MCNYARYTACSFCRAYMHMPNKLPLTGEMKGAQIIVDPEGEPWAVWECNRTTTCDVWIKRRDESKKDWPFKDGHEKVPKVICSNYCKEQAATRKANEEAAEAAKAAKKGKGKGKGKGKEVAGSKDPGEGSSKKRHH